MITRWFNDDIWLLFTKFELTFRFYNCLQSILKFFHFNKADFFHLCFFLPSMNKPFQTSLGRGTCNKVRLRQFRNKKKIKGLVFIQFFVQKGLFYQASFYWIIFIYKHQYNLWIVNFKFIYKNILHIIEFLYKNLLDASLYIYIRYICIKKNKQFKD